MPKKIIPINTTHAASTSSQDDLLSFIDWKPPFDLAQPLDALDTLNTLNTLDTLDTLDTFNRALNDLRISVTDRCNFRCHYCMPKDVFDKNYHYSPQHALLDFEEIVRLATIFIGHGVKKIRLTGGEPLLRKNIEELIAQLSLLRDQKNNPIDLSLTTNGSLLMQKAQALKKAGLHRLTISLDALDDTIFQAMNDVQFPVKTVLEGIAEAQRVGFENIKINMVVKKGVNDQEILPMVNYFKNTPHVLRFIEYMDVGSTNQWQRNEVVSSEDILRNLAQHNMHFTPLPAHYASETAERWQHSDGQGEIGFISSVSKAFCHECTRARLSTQGMLYTCLFASKGFDLKSLIRHNARPLLDQEISNIIAHIWHHREDRYSLLRHKNENENEIENNQNSELNATNKIEPQQTPKIEMSYIGG